MPCPVLTQRTVPGCMACIAAAIKGTLDKQLSALGARPFPVLVQRIQCRKTDQVLTRHVVGPRRLLTQRALGWSGFWHRCSRLCAGKEQRKGATRLTADGDAETREKLAASQADTDVKRGAGTRGQESGHTMRTRERAVNVLVMVARSLPPGESSPSYRQSSPSYRQTVLPFSLLPSTRRDRNRGPCPTMLGPDMGWDGLGWSSGR
eukprot:3082256-Rhodomonas_salina.1